MDFGFNGKGGDNATKGDTPNNNADGSPITDISTGKADNSVNGLPADDINGITHTGDNNDSKDGKPNDGKSNSNDGKGKGTDDTKPDAKPDGKPDDKGADNKGTDADGTLEVGSIIEVGDLKYTVDPQGNLTNPDGSIFKQAKDVKDWLATFDTVNDNTNEELSISAIQDLVGIEIVGDDDKPVEFENTPAGVKAYLDAVNDATREDHHTEAVNTLFQQYPILPDVLNYYIANGNSLDGYNEVRDRSGITIDDSNQAQQESIVRTAWKEQNRKGDVEDYISYLKSSGKLLAVSQVELKGLQETDTQVKQQLAEQAEKVEQARIEKLQNYWGSVREIITKKNIAGYELPDVIVRTNNGQKTSATLNDFYNYVYQVDGNGKSAYERDRIADDPKSKVEDELLRAYLKFVGGNYSNLVGMAVNKDKVKTLKLQAQNRTTNSVKVTKPKTDTPKGVNTDFGYN